MSTERPADRSEQALLAELDALLADPALQDNPLHAPLDRLLALYRQQNERVERLVRISDGYHGLSRNQSSNLADKFERQVRRLEKLARISDLYQNNLRELTEALREASLKDPLTDLGNRRYLMDRLKEETVRARRKNVPLCVAVLDVDHFKRVNDTWGHEAGDETLRRISEVLRSSVREYDTVGRWGGEEFLLLFPETGLEEALNTAERVRQSISEIRIERPDGPIQLTASLGLAQQLAGESASATVSRADNALLSAKRKGRDRTVIG
ncbi:GGDEF domain-containing protein [Thauera sp. CAU 1555]|uniref:diguanylate cyclase n=1 Tax=Thauera sedimentorum TaxID=2767595 RepID=A0ABR9B900_9RHOO|nr:biofilm regulation diguanylate cyclase SiaD [Thauera sedimentorum]MBC9071003.1 GGDEF domain-containing protein [Thauera sedimentorum]MBD8501922.1 GGDEF domain-containing protein [Thauera sedimentorum]